eukprot:4119379-Amphidinium_carterae.1
MACTPSDSTLLAAGADRVARSSDSGQRLQPTGAKLEDQTKYHCKDSADTLRAKRLYWLQQCSKTCKNK